MPDSRTPESLYAPDRGGEPRRHGRLDRSQLRNRNASSSVEADDFTVTRYRQFARYISAAPSTVLDVGSHEGVGGEVLAGVRPDTVIVALDVLPECLVALPEPYVAGTCAMVPELPFRDESFDVIVAGEVIEHVAPSDVDEMLCEMQRVLRVGGRLLLTTPNPGYLRNRLTGRSVLGRSHLTQQEAKVLRFRLRMHGFRSIRIRGTGRVSRFLGRHFPVRAVYGAYLVVADKW